MYSYTYNTGNDGTFTGTMKITVLAQILKKKALRTQSLQA